MQRLVGQRSADSPQPLSPANSVRGRCRRYQVVAQSMLARSPAAQHNDSTQALVGVDLDAWGLGDEATTPFASATGLSKNILARSLRLSNGFGAQLRGRAGWSSG